ncbi:MAG: dihydrofolate reductase family protein, partial [Frankia sp.]|nr:dihydrofolate reductase family protein [Frankia sp.]
PTLAGAFVDARLVDRVICYVAPVLLGGAGLPALGGHGAQTIGSAWRLHVDEVTPIGADVRITARPEKAAG